MTGGRFLVLGAGGLGCPALLGLTAAGARELAVVDCDVVDATNLHRQVLYDLGDVGAPKVEAAARRLRERVPQLRVEPISVRLTRLLQVFNLAVPANEAIGLAALGTLGPVDSYPRIFRDDPMRNALLEFGWLPTRHGALLISLPVLAENELFDPQPRLLVFQGPVTMVSCRSRKQISSAAVEAATASTTDSANSAGS